MKNSKIQFEICGSDKYASGMICIPEVDGTRYLCRDGNVYDWENGNKEAIKEICYFQNRTEAQFILDQYDNTIDKKIVKLKNMVKDLRIRYNPELLVEVYKFVENL